MDQCRASLSIALARVALGAGLIGAQLCRFLLRHIPGRETETFLTQGLACLLEDFGEFLRVGVSTARDASAADYTSTTAVDHTQAEFDIAVMRSPGHALIRLKSTVGDQQSIIEAERGVHGVGLLRFAQLMNYRQRRVPQRLVTVTDAES